ncbi:MAG: DUF1080 domain-containing protein, partial [Fimbriimonadaceae bacterium]|nr:DUF1080 domain-containing protein [Fimbriimonadaceae bacterium]
QVNLSTAADFGGLEDNFLVHLTGDLIAPTDGLYRFRLISDDGSRFSLRDEVIVDHDGLHGATPAEGSFRLSAGRHPIFIEYFEATVDNVLRLEWMPPGATEWTLVPSANLSTRGGEVKVTAPGFKEILETGEVRRPGDRTPLTSVHPAFDLVTIRPETFRPRVGGIDFLGDKIVVCNWEPDGGVYVVENALGLQPRPKVTRIAAGLAEPLGISVVGGRIYVLQKQELTRLDDLDGDGIIDRHYALATGWGVTSNFHEFAFGLTHHRGRFYANLAIAIDPGGKSTQPQNPDRGKVMEIDMNGRVRFIADGLRTPNGIGFGTAGEIYITDNQGDWLPSSKVVMLKEGAFYGSRAVDPVGRKDTPEVPPVVWLPQNEIGNSPSEITPFNFGPYRDQMVHGDVTHGSLKRVFSEVVQGVRQGVVFRFTQGLEGGVNRVRVAPDGRSLVVGGIGSTGNWGQEGKERFGLQRMVWNGKVPFEMLSVESRRNGFLVTFTQPVLAGHGDRPEDWRVDDFRYVPTVEYGGPKVDPRRLEVKSVTFGAGRRQAFLEIEGLEENRVVHIVTDPVLASGSGEVIWTTEAWYTLNRISPKVERVVSSTQAVHNTLTPAEQRDGWKLLFDGKSVEPWMAWGSDRRPGAGWSAENGTLTLTPGIGGGDIMTPQDYEDFELVLDWKVGPGGNSGIFWHADSASGRPAYETGPEMQILDNARHPDGRNPLTAAGSDYALIAGRGDLVREAGRWNSVRIRVKDGLVQYFMNGIKTVEYRLGSPEWEALLRGSKFASWPRFGRAGKGRIVLQDHGDSVSFRNIKIRVLD